MPRYNHINADQSDGTVATTSQTPSKSGTPPAVARVRPPDPPRPAALPHPDSSVRSIGKGKSPPAFIIIRFLLLAGSIGLWEVLAAAGLIDPFFYGRPWLIASRLWADLQFSLFWTNLWTTIQAAVLGLAIGSIVGFLLGLLFTYNNTIRRALDPLVYGLYAIPRIALTPLMVLWFGIGPASKVALAVAIVFFIMLLNTHKGITTVDKELVDAVRLMGASRRFVFRTVTFPATVPWLIAGLRLSTAYAFMSVIGGEMIAAVRGIGRMLVDRQIFFDTNGIFSLLLVISLIAVLIDSVARRVEGHFSLWRLTPRTTTR